jgi:hypothetical protein
MIRGMMQLTPYTHKPRYPWLASLPPAVRAALREPRPPESPPVTIIAGGQLWRFESPRVDLRCTGWRRWLNSPEGAAWLASPPGQRWAKGARGAKWAAREGVASCGC